MAKVLMNLAEMMMVRVKPRAVDDDAAVPCFRVALTSPRRTLDRYVQQRTVYRARATLFRFFRLLTPLLAGRPRRDAVLEIPGEPAGR